MTQILFLEKLQNKDVHEDFPVNSRADLHQNDSHNNHPNTLT